jgi:hypothetical protein
VPPAGEELSVVVKPVQTEPVPVIAAGCVLTVTGLVEKQPPDNVYVITVVPALTPFTTPVEEPTVATPVLPLVQVPPVGEELRAVVEPVQTDAVPVIAEGALDTVTAWVAKQPPDNVYVITAVPVLTPFTTPVEEPTVAIPVPPLVQVPPVGEELRVVVEPVQTEAVPVIADGCVLTVTAWVAKQPPDNVYVITAVPALTPLTTPVEEPTVATPVLPLVHVPPAGEELSVVEEPVQTEAVPVIAAGWVFTVTVAVEKQPPDNV